MLQLEILGRTDAIATAKAELASFLDNVPRQFAHRGADGAAGISGLVALILPSFIPKLIEVLKGLLVRDRDLIVTINGFQFAVKDVTEAGELIKLLKDRGLLTTAGDYDEE